MKLFFAFVAACLCTFSVGAQEVRTPVFSPALLSGPVHYNNYNTKARRIVPSRKSKAAARVTTYLYYSDGQIDMTPEQKEQLVPIVKRITSGETRQVVMSGVSSSEEDSKRRLNQLAIFLRDYNRDVNVQAHVVDSKNVIRNNNVVQIIEKK